MYKKVLVFLFFLITFSSSIPHTNFVQAKSIVITSNQKDGISMHDMARSDKVRWRYKTIDGVLYKRQYNYSKEKWLGKWVRA